jgi:hypothetical protein
MIPLPDTIVQPHTMMIHPLNTLIALAAVTYSWQFYINALVAPFGLLYEKLVLKRPANQPIRTSRVVVIREWGSFRAFTLARLFILGAMLCEFLAVIFMAGPGPIIPMVI